MKILLSSPYQRKYQAQYFYIKALKSLGHKVEVFWYNQLFGKNIQPNNKLGIKAAIPINNAKLKIIAKDFKPDILLLNTGVDIINSSTIKYIKSLGSKTTLFSGDSPKKLLNFQFETKYLKYFDAVFVSDDIHKKEWQSLEAQKVFNLPIFAIDPIFHKYTPSKNSKLSSDVCFVGSLFLDRQNSLKEIASLLPESIDLKIWGHIYPEAPLDRSLIPYYQGLAWEKESVKIFSQSKIALNFIPTHMGSGGNMRTFEIPATKTLQLVDKINPSWYQIGSEVIVFRNPKQAAKQIISLLANDKKRKSLAQKGYRRTKKDHTYKKRFANFVKIVNSL
jgi:spore maturation protein CgeB